MVKELRKKAFEEAVKILSVSFGFVCISLLFSLGATLIIGEIYWGIIPIVIGYELLRVVVKYLWKHQLGGWEI